ncbi:hypothetical protein PpBr36_03873 [Pyricularia pennisetigena]|uniref:hypothetical protein n=1 Tax=Pyricularia pennisetigena TaxID=1578925 RepID=UPI00114F203B|nr:hypothetical protein PpBr36_03873 [Pyricularia pennisetigena]TLS31024.1 hypothetical protein PpBr36_03873 [Pyricularia pennisetigena]
MPRFKSKSQSKSHSAEMSDQDVPSEPFRGDPPSTEVLLENLEQSQAKIDECYQIALANEREKNAKLEKELADALEYYDKLVKQLEALKIAADKKRDAANNPPKQ